MPAFWRSVWTQTLTDWEHVGQLIANQQHQRQQEEKLYAHWRQHALCAANLGEKTMTEAARRSCRRRLGLGF